MMEGCIREALATFGHGLRAQIADACRFGVGKWLEEI
jgi:hypothetical protein